MTSPMMRVSEVAEALQVSEGVVRSMVNTGELPCRRLGRRGLIRIPREAVREFCKCSGDYPSLVTNGPSGSGEAVIEQASDIHPKPAKKRALSRQALRVLTSERR